MLLKHNKINSQTHVHIYIYMYKHTKHSRLLMQRFDAGQATAKGKQQQCQHCYLN